MNENKVLNELAEWIQKRNIRVLQDHSRDNNIPVFKIKGDQHKPDLIAMNGQTTAIEVKIGNDTNTLGANSGLLNYFNNYCEGKTIYFDNKERPIKIDNFVLATRNSKHGRLKDKEPVHEDSERSQRKFAVQKGYLPEIEYESTFTILRTGIWQHINREKYCNCGVGIGLLLSSILGYKPDTYNWRNINITDEPIPAVVVEIPNQKILTKNGDHRWGFEWKPL